MQAWLGYSLLFFSLPQFAMAGAWLPNKAEGKLIAGQIEQTQKSANIIYFRHREIYQSLLLEYAFSDKLGLAVKAGQQERHLPQGHEKNTDTRIGLLIDTPRLATGLLPPFSFRLAKSLLPAKILKREKRAVMTLGFHNESDEYWSGLTLGDRIYANRFRLTQEIELERIRSKQRDWNNWLYRFSLGYGRIDIGTEATHFVDEKSGYQALAHSGFVQVKIRRLQVRLKHGERRAPMGGLAVQNNDYLSLEIEMNF